MAPWPARPVLVLVLLLALLCSHIALCSSAADSGKPSKPKASGGRKALLAAASLDDGDDGDETPVVKPPAKKKAAAVAAVGKIKKKVGDAADAKNQTAKAATKAKKPESATAAKGTTAKKTTSSKAAGTDGAVAKSAKVPKTDKATAKAKGAADSAAAAKVKSSDSAKPAKVSKSSAAKAAKPAKPAKSDSTAAGAAKLKKPTNSTVGVELKAKSGKKKAAQPVVVAEDKPTAKATATKDEEPTTESVVVDTDVAAFAAEAGAEDSDDLISEFRDLPSRLQETLMPDLARLSHSSKAYLSAANAGIADGVRPLLGGRWAAALATAASVALLLLPLCALTAAVRRAGAYLPLLHRALLLAQAYLAIYFATLALAAAATGLEPLRFFHAASPAAYAWTQAAQSLGFVAYLVLQMVDLVAVFSGAAAASPVEDGGSGNGDAAKALGLAQMVVGLAVGLHYYAAVFHRAAAGEAPRANWRVYAVYAACFVVICACARAERRKKAYLADGAAEEWKKS